MKIELSLKHITTLLALLELEISDIKRACSSVFDDTFKFFYSQELFEYQEIFDILSSALSFN